MEAVEINGDWESLPVLTPSLSRAFAALSVLFDECVRDVSTPLDIEGRDRLAQRFDETLELIAQELDELSFRSAPSLLTISCSSMLIFLTM